MNRLIFIHTPSVVAIPESSVIPTMPITCQKLTPHQPPPITTSMLRTPPAWPVIWVKVTRITRSWCKVTTPSWGKKTILITSALIDFCLRPTPVEQGDTERTSRTHELVFTGLQFWCMATNLFVVLMCDVELGVAADR